jgi:hypothetical protein
LTLKIDEKEIAVSCCHTLLHIFYHDENNCLTIAYRGGRCTNGKGLCSFSNQACDGRFVVVILAADGIF